MQSCKLACAALAAPEPRRSLVRADWWPNPNRDRAAIAVALVLLCQNYLGEDLLRRVRTFVLPAIEKSGRISAWIVDDTGFHNNARGSGI